MLTFSLAPSAMKMRVGLIDVDGHNFPNFALLKIAAWLKHNGHHVEWADPMFGEYDRIYKSKIFTFTPDESHPWDCEVVKGGTGYDVHSVLPVEIEALNMVDYSIYPQYDFSIEFLSRGCIRHCPFCLVHDKEGGGKTSRSRQFKSAWQAYRGT